MKPLDENDGVSKEEEENSISRYSSETPRFNVNVVVAVKDGETLKFTIKSQKEKALEAILLQRIYEDFEWLHHCLTTHNDISGLIVPPLPLKPEVDAKSAETKSKRQLGSESNLVIGDEFQRECQRIEKYLQLMLSHEVFQNDQYLSRFLSESEPPTRVKLRKGILHKLSNAVDEVRKGNHKDIDDYFQKTRDWANNYSTLMKDTSDNYNQMMCSQYSTMYDKSARKLNSEVGSTPYHVGPGTYEIKDKKSTRREGYAPFLSLSSRDHDPYFSKISSSQAPGPGWYDIHLKKCCNGGNSIQFKSKRFSSFIGDNIPGPGHYDFKEETEDKTLPIEVIRPVFKQINAKLKMYQRPEPPSIPTPKTACGYQEGEDGYLIKQLPQIYDTTLGPAFYDVKMMRELPYKGCHFGHYTSSKGFYNLTDFPGPGEYNVCDKPKNQRTWPPRNTKDKILPQCRHGGQLMKQKCSSLKIKATVLPLKEEDDLSGYVEYFVRKDKRPPMPGPAKYYVKSQFDKRPMQFLTFIGGRDPPPFDIQTRRFLEPTNDNPAPGFYNDPRTALQTTSKAAGNNMSPFGQSSVRFHPNMNDNKLPGPGSYNIATFSPEAMRKALQEVPNNAVFGTTAPRNTIITYKNLLTNPGPADYNVKSGRFDKPTRTVKPSPCFASATDRTTINMKDVNPAPNAYDLKNAFTSCYDEVLPKNRKTFLSSTGRCGPGRDILNLSQKKFIPGPGAYDVPQCLIPPKQHTLSKSERFYPRMLNDVPGPGAYELPPMITDTLVKGLAGFYCHFSTTLKQTGLYKDIETIKTNRIMACLSLCLDDYKNEIEVLCNNEEESLGFVFELYARYMDSVKEMLFRRTCLLVGFENANRMVDKAKPPKRQLAEENRENACKAFEDCSKVAQNELKFFIKQRLILLQEGLHTFAESQIKTARDTYALLAKHLRVVKEID